MGKFSEILKKHFESGKFSAYHLANATKIDRSTLYKILQGRRVPSSIDLVEKIIQFMGMDNNTADKLREAYFIDKYGEENYRSRIELIKFLNIPLQNFKEQKYVVNYSRTVIIGEKNILDFVSGMISEEKSKIMLSLSNFSKEPMIPLQKKTNLNVLLNLNHECGIEEEICNMNHILTIFPNAHNIQIKYNYNGNTNGGGSNLLFSDFIISGKKLVIINTTWTEGIIITDSTQINLFKKIFEENFFKAEVYIEYLENDITSILYNIDSSCIYCGKEFIKKQKNAIVFNKYINIILGINKEAFFKSNFNGFPEDRALVLLDDEIIFLYFNFYNEINVIQIRNIRIANYIKICLEHMFEIYQQDIALFSENDSNHS